jgi:hypothetical protein
MCLMGERRSVGVVRSAEPVGLIGSVGSVGSVFLAVSRKTGGVRWSVLQDATA